MIIKNKDIIQSYIMTTARYDYSADEKRILFRLVETFQHLLEGQKITNGRIDKTLFGDYELELPISHFLPGESKNYSRMKDAFRSLNEKKFEYEDDKLWEIIRIVEKPKIENREKVRFELNAKIVDCFLNFTKGYRKFELETAFSFSSVYAMRFYELFSGQKKPITYTIENLKKMFVIEDKYPRNPDFIKRVIEPAKKELDEKSPYSFEYKVNKIGPQFHSINFYPVATLNKREQNFEVDAVLKKEYISNILDRHERDYLFKFGFTERQLKNNMTLILQAKKELDLVYELSLLIGAVRTKNNPQGYVISTLKGKLKDKGVEILKK